MLAESVIDEYDSLLENSEWYRQSVGASPDRESEGLYVRGRSGIVRIRDAVDFGNWIMDTDPLNEVSYEEILRVIEAGQRGAEY